MNEKIKDFVRENLILPDIQRDFVWDNQKICKLFDSILRGYPIGNMLIWKLKGENLNKRNIRFYEFLKNYNEFSPEKNNRLLNAEPNTTYYAILDGQQRTQSLIIGLNGFLNLRKYRGKIDDPRAYKKNYLYINLLADENKEEDYKYEFKFLTEDLAKNDREKKWFQVCRTVNFSETSEMQQEIIDEYKLEGQEEKKARKVLAELFDKINNSKELINWFEISAETDIDEVLNIFVRTNSGGVVLSKTDLLFSTIVSDWTEAREKVEELLDTINNKGGVGTRFRFTKDFVMRTILYILDKPIQMNVSTFKDNIKDIKNNWEKIEWAFKEAPGLLKYLGFSGDNLIAYNAVMPIIYYIYKGGDIKSSNEREEIRKYLVISQLEKLYGVASNSTLINVREALRKEVEHNVYELKDKSFKFANLKEVKIGDRSFNIDEGRVEKWFEYNKSDYTFMILSLLYPCAKIGTTEFHQDHMHPESKLKKTIYSKDRNRLANLQLIEGKENESKNDIDLIEWLENDSKRKENEKYLPQNCSLSIDNYEEFLEKRKQLMKAELLKLLKLN